MTVPIIKRNLNLVVGDFKGLPSLLLLNLCNSTWKKLFSSCEMQILGLFCALEGCKLAKSFSQEPL